MTHPTLHQLQIFMTVVRRRSFARAAEELYLNPSSVSLQIKRLEAAYGVALLDRHPAGDTNLTAAGSIVYDAAVALFERLAEAEHAIERLIKRDSGRLSIGAGLLIGAYRLPEALELFRRRHPGIEPTLVITNPAKVEEKVLSDEIEIGITGRDVRSPSLVAEPIIDVGLSLFCHPNSAIATHKVLNSNRLIGETLLSREVGSSTREAVDAAIDSGRLHFENVIEVNGMDEMILGIQQGKGVGFAPELYFTRAQRHRQLVALNVRDAPITVTYRLIHHRLRPLSSSAMEFLKCCRRVFTETQTYLSSVP